LEIPGLDDSKRVPEKKREALYGVIRARARACACAFATAEEIDGLNILNAVYLAMNRAIAALEVAPGLALIDGNRGEGIGLRHECVVSGDGKCMTVAAASILAKVERDRYMRALAREYPGYGFERHKGYGTRGHYAAIREFGLTPEHRRSFRLK
jgi:ribonuclease HII